MIIQLLQLVVLTVLAFCIFFGLGFIINMLLKTTWFPIIAYLIFVAILVYWSWGWNFIDALLHYSLSDDLPLLSGLLGAICSGYIIKVLRLKGYKMF